MHIIKETVEASYEVRSRRRLLKSYTRRLTTILGIGLAFLAVTVRAEFLFVANTDSSSVCSYRIAENGTLTPSDRLL